MRHVARRSARADRPPTARDTARPGERGSATVEAALSVGVIVAVMALGLGAGASVLAQLRCADAAREAARLVARGEADRAQDVARSVAPGGASVSIRVSGDEVTVVVSADPPLPGVDVSASAMAVLEPGVVS